MTFNIPNRVNKQIEDYDFSKSVENILEEVKLKPDKNMSTGFKCIDKRLALEGLKTKSLFLIYGKSGVGKSYFITNWIFRLLKLGVNILFFSLEMNKEDILVRLNQLLQNLNYDDSFLNMKYKQKLFWDGIHKYKVNERLIIHEVKEDMFNIDNILFGIRHAKKKNFIPDFVFIDHLHEIFYNEDTYKKTTNLIALLKNIAKVENTRLIVLTQIRRGTTKNVGIDLPTLEDGKGSGALEEKADCILSIARKDMDNQGDNIIQASFLKVRQSGRYGSGGIMEWHYNKTTSELKEKFI